MPITYDASTDTITASAPEIADLIAACARGWADSVITQSVEAEKQRQMKIKRGWTDEERAEVAELAQQSRGGANLSDCGVQPAAEHAPKRQRRPSAKTTSSPYVATADDCQSIPDCHTYCATGQSGPCKFQGNGCNEDA